MDLYHRMYDMFWDDNFWFANVTSWKHLAVPPKGVYYPKTNDLVLPSIIVAVVIICLRTLLDRLVILPVGLACGLKDKKIQFVEENKILQESFKKCSVPNQQTIEELSKKTGMPMRKIQRWFRRSRNNVKMGTLKKFREVSFLLLYYTFAFFGGLYILWDKPWLWTARSSFDNLLAWHVSNDIYWYYLIEMGFYISLVFTLSSDNKRSDFREMIIHHAAAIFLITFSWMCNLVRIGTLVLLSHDIADIFLCGAKVCVYLKRTVLQDVIFGLFIISWILSRLYYYPMYVVHTAFFYGLELVEYKVCFVHVFFNFLLITLLLLHLFWTYLIIKTVVNKFARGNLNDARSDTEESDSYDESSVIKNGKENIIKEDMAPENGVANGYSSKAVQRTNKKSA